MKRYIADFHVHSRYSRACSKNLELETIAGWSMIKGIHVISTGDFTHPAWFGGIREKLEESYPGLYRLKGDWKAESQRIAREYLSGPLPEQQFILTTEVSCIYSKNGKVRRIHLLVFLPSIAAVERFNAALKAAGGNLSSDGRPILGIDAKEIARMAFEISEDAFIVPAHAWTPWFAVFGSKSGFDSLQECFDELTPRIAAIETGLSSDPLMNWGLSGLDGITLISNSDAHSPEKMGREANVFLGDSVSYGALVEAMRHEVKGGSLRLASTIEFYPEEGMYHIDGHRSCGFSCEPEETKRRKGICPVCKKALTIGVLHRVNDLSDRDPERIRKSKTPFVNIIPLPEIIAQCCGVKSTQSPRVKKIYREVIHRLGSEFEILLDCSADKIFEAGFPEIARGIAKMRSGDAKIVPGYDGVYGTITVCDPPRERQAKLL